MSYSDSMPFPQRVIAVSRAASGEMLPGAPPFKDANRDHLTIPALAALCRHYGLEVHGVTTEDSAATNPGSFDSMPFPQRILDIAHACGGDGPPDTRHTPLAGEVLDHLSIPALRGVARRYDLITVEKCL